MNYYGKGLRELLLLLAKRLVMLAAKLAGFKACCLYLATVLLVKGVIPPDVWLYVMLAVLCSVSGLRVFDSLAARGMKGAEG